MRACRTTGAPGVANEFTHPGPVSPGRRTIDRTGLTRQRSRRPHSSKGCVLARPAGDPFTDTTRRVHHFPLLPMTEPGPSIQIFPIPWLGCSTQAAVHKDKLNRPECDPDHPSHPNAWNVRTRYPPSRVRNHPQLISIRIVRMKSPTAETGCAAVGLQHFILNPAESFPQVTPHGIQAGEVTSTRSDARKLDSVCP